VRVKAIEGPWSSGWALLSLGPGKEIANRGLYARLRGIVAARRPLAGGGGDHGGAKPMSVRWTSAGDPPAVLNRA